MGLSRKKLAMRFCWHNRCPGSPSWPTALTNTSPLGLTAALFGLLLLPSASAEAVTTFDDITFWAGAGENRAAMVLDWDDTSTTDESLVWGYRWDGTATGEEMLLTILEADPRLFAKISRLSSSGTSLYGLGYDRNDDSQFAISDSTTFNADGIALSSPADGATSEDSKDRYAEGWFQGFWNYGLGNGNPFDDGAWIGSGTGMSGRMLSDGDWDSWAFTPTFDFTAAAENPHAANPPGDFNRDGIINAADYTVWRDTLGSTTQLVADADGSGVVDAADYTLWKSNFGIVTGETASAASGEFTTASAPVPEPSTLTLTILAFIFWISVSQRKKKSHEFTT